MNIFNKTIVAKDEHGPNGEELKLQVILTPTLLQQCISLESQNYQMPFYNIHS